jgi:hypothetical protein
LVILISAFQRLLLYENAYGFSRLRTYTFVFIPWLALLLLGTVVLEIARQRGKFSLVLMAACIGFCLSIGFINVDGLITHMNVQRARRGLVLDANYLGELSADAIPAMVEEYQIGGLQKQVTNSLAAVLACKVEKYRQIPQLSWNTWQSINYADQRAKTLLWQMQDQLTDIPIRQVSGTWFVTINGLDKICFIE